MTRSSFNIAFLTVRLSDGGSERVIANLASSFACHNYKTTVITYRRSIDEYPINESVIRYNLDDYRENNGHFGKLSHFLRIKSICEREKIDVIISFGNGPIAHSLLIKILLGIKAVIPVRNAPDFLYNSRLTKWGVRWIYNIADGAVFQTEEAKKWFRKELQYKSSIIYNPVGEIFFSSHYNPEPNRIITCGRLQPQKNHRLLLDAVEIVSHSINNIRLYIYGVGPLEKELKEYASEKGLSSIVHFEGRSTNIPMELSKASVFVLSSNVEGVPNALMEAMAVGVPSVATDCPCGGPRMLLGENDRGILVPVNNESELANSIICLLADENKRNKYSELSKEFAKNFSVEQVFSEWQKFLLNVYKF